MRTFVFNALLLLSNSIAQMGPEIAYRFVPPTFYDESSSINTDKTLEEYWEETAIGISTYITYFNTEKCYSSDQYLIACVKAANVLVSLTNEKWQIHPEKQGLFKLIRTPEDGKFGGLILGEYSEIEKPKPALKPTLRTNYLEYTKDIAAYDKAILDSIKTGNDEVEFEQILIWLTKENKTISKYAFGMSLNQLLIEGIDSHTSIMPTQYLKDVQKKERGQAFAGIGANLLFIQNQLVISAVASNGPAEAAGLKKYDTIIKIDGEKVVLTDENHEEILKKIRSETVGSKVMLTIANEDGIRDVTLTRQIIQQQNVLMNWISGKGEDAVYHLTISSFFNDNTCEDATNLLMTVNKYSSIILDLRGNSGGFLHEAACISSLFSGPAKLVVVSYPVMGSEHKPQGYPTYYWKPMKGKLVVLIDADSASGSEVVAGFLSETKRAYTLGTRSFGKGTILSPVEDSNFNNLGLTYYKTEAYFFVNNAWTPHRIGVKPDFEFYRKPNPSLDEKFALREAELYRTSVKHVGPLPAISKRRTKKIAKLSKCITKEGKADSVYKNSLTKIFPADYQLEKAIDLISCMN
ncbi:MAG: PDZ domain-containing protein [Bacteriovoracaceae bacterium]|nr:PDZ domain-containing protein [Bacteriovoracaceae bacterium]